MAVPRFETARLILRPLDLGDADDVFAYAQDEAVARLGMWEPYESFQEFQEWLDRTLGDERLMWWALQHRGSGRVIGRVQLSEHSRRDGHAELSYALARDYWGQGLMTEAIQPVVAYAWDLLGLHRLGATVLPSNLASIRLLQSVGMEKEGRLREHRRLYGAWHDVDVYAVIRRP